MAFSEGQHIHAQGRPSWGKQGLGGRIAAAGVQESFDGRTPEMPM